NHSLPVLFRPDFIAVLILYDVPVFVLQGFAFVSEIKVKFSVRTGNEGMHAVIVLFAAYALKKDFLPVGLQVSVVVIKYPHIGALRNDDPVLQHTDPDRKSTRLNSSHVKISYAVFCL